MRRTLHILWKYHTFKAFAHLKSRVRREKILQDKHKIDGAYIMMEELGQHLKKLDKALERMWKEKSDRHDFEMLKLSVDETRAKTIFNDMKELFETTIADYKHTLDQEKAKMRDAFTFML